MSDKPADQTPKADTMPEAPAEEKKPESVLWKVAGGLAAGLGLAVVVAVYFHVQGQLAGLRKEVSDASKEMRAEIARLGQGQGVLAKKEEVSTRLKNVWDRLKELQTGRTDLTSLRERCALLGELYKAGEAERKELADQVRKMRERGKAAEEKAELTKEMRMIRERIAQLETKPSAE
jgi:chromosome segregation ATPase